MAPVAAILGSVFGTIAAVVGWLLFGLGLLGVVQVYFLVSLLVAAALIGYALLQPKPAPKPDPEGLQRA
ncbi:hypothetical protein [Roseovarius sp. 2305UL8-3]|uniref:hypothetical protein n=1 Tax=Roseovarius conchicola TaxID=3121636 RepID=UPI003527C133